MAKCESMKTNSCEKKESIFISIKKALLYVLWGKHEFLQCHELWITQEIKKETKKPKQ